MNFRVYNNGLKLPIVGTNLGRTISTNQTLTERPTTLSSSSDSNLVASGLPAKKAIDTSQDDNAITLADPTLPKAITDISTTPVPIDPAVVIAPGTNSDSTALTKPPNFKTEQPKALPQPLIFENISLEEIHRRMLLLYRSNINLLGAVLEQAMENYVILIKLKAKIYGITNVLWEKEPTDETILARLAKNEIYYDFFTDRENCDMLPRPILSEGDKRILQIQQQQILPKALQKVEKVMNEIILARQNRCIIENLVETSNLLPTRINIWDTLTQQEQISQCTQYYDIHVSNKKLDDVFISKREEYLFRPIYGGLHRLLLLIQAGEFHTEYKPAAENKRFIDEGYKIQSPLLIQR